MTPLRAYLLGALSVLVLLVLVELIATLGGSSFLTSVVIGEDNRTSTSKTFILMWTLLVAWALASLLIVGVLIGMHPCATLANLQQATNLCTAEHDQVGLLQIGWRQFANSGLSGSYLLLLGIPAAAGVAAKAITQSKTDSGAVVQVTPPPQQGIGLRVAQIFSADDQTTDLGDFQYMIFNLLAAAVFVSEFVRANSQGLPTIPDTLLGLTSVSAALYVAKKATTRTQAKITGVFPAILRAGQVFTVTGSGLTASSTGRTTRSVVPPRVTINGVAALSVASSADGADRLSAIVPTGLLPTGATVPIAGTIQVLSARGAIAPAFDVQLS